MLRRDPVSLWLIHSQKQSIAVTILSTCAGSQENHGLIQAEELWTRWNKIRSGAKRRGTLRTALACHKCLDFFHGFRDFTSQIFMSFFGNNDVVLDANT